MIFMYCIFPPSITVSHLGHMPWQRKIGVEISKINKGSQRPKISRTTALDQIEESHIYYEKFNWSGCLIQYYSPKSNTENTETITTRVFPLLGSCSFNQIRSSLQVSAHTTNTHHQHFASMFLNILSATICLLIQRKLHELNGTYSHACMGRQASCHVIQSTKTILTIFARHFMDQLLLKFFIIRFEPQPSGLQII